MTRTRVLIVATSLIGMLVASAAYQNDPNHHQQPHWSLKDRIVLRTTIDYSSANEYIADNYPELDRPYFSPSIQSDHPIYNARKGVYDYKTRLWKPASLESCGFALSALPCHEQSHIDWSNLKSIQENYLPRLETVVRQSLSSLPIRQIIFWHPVLRGEEYMHQVVGKQGLSTAHMRVAIVAHIDIDFGSFDGCTGMAELIAKNVLLPSEQKVDEWKGMMKSHRFAMINAWCNIHSSPIQRSPLALMHPVGSACFPNAVPSPVADSLESSMWYVFPEMKHDEVLLFYQYDRDARQVSDVWHQALVEDDDDDDDNAATPKRKSFDIRMLVIFDEAPPEETNDRLTFR